MLGAFDDGVFEMAELGPRAIEPIAKILARYEDLRPQLADASLLYLAERENIGTIFMLDRRDFSVYRTKRIVVCRLFLKSELGAAGRGKWSSSKTGTKNSASGTNFLKGPRSCNQQNQR